MKEGMGRLPVLLLLLAGWAAYHNSFTVPFLFDDLSSIVMKEALRTLWPPGPLLASTRPLVELTLALNYGLGRLEVWGYHAFNLLIHGMAGLTLFGILRRTLGRPGLAFSAALLWSVHPLQTQSVTYIAQRAESMMGLFYLFTLYAALRADGGRNARLWKTLAVVSCALGAGTKAIIVTAPLAVMLYDRSFLFASFKQAWGARRAFYIGLLATWTFLIPAAWIAIRAPAQTVGFDLGDLTPLRYAATQPEVLLHYLRLAVFPSPLVFDYAWQPVAAWTQAFAPTLALGVLLAGSLWLWRRKPHWGFWAVWFFLALAPTSSFIPVADLAAEHRMYLPLAGVVTLLTLAGAYLLRRLLLPEPLRRKLATAAVVLLAATLCGLTIRRNEDYRSEISLWSDTLAKRPENPRAHLQVGKSLALQGQAQQAIAHLERALQLKPDFLAAHNNLGNVLAEQGRWQEALFHYETALEIHPRFVDARVNLGNLLLRLGKTDRAIEQYQRALQDDPTSSQARNNLGAALRLQNRLRNQAP